MFDEAQLDKVVNRAPFAGVTVNQSTESITVHSGPKVNSTDISNVQKVPLPAGWTVSFDKVARDWDDLSSIRDKIDSTESLGSTIATELSTWGINPDTNTVDVGLTSVAPGLQSLADKEFGVGAVRFKTVGRFHLFKGHVSKIFNGSAGKAGGPQPNAAGQSRDSEGGGPYHGGSDITTDAVVAKGDACEFGFVFTISGTRYGLTAGHCGTGTGNSVVHTGFSLNNVSIGRVQHRTYNDGHWDTEYFSGGDSLSSAVWIGAADTTTGRQVSQTLTPSNGSSTCANSSVGGEFCNATVSRNSGQSAKFKEEDNGVIETVTGLGLLSTPGGGHSQCYGGDSGGPIESHLSAGLGAVGTIVGGDSTNCYYEPIDAVLSHWGGTLYTQ